MKKRMCGYVTLRAGALAALVLGVFVLASCAQSVGGGKAADNRLGSLQSDAGTLEPAFDPEVTDYALGVPYDTELVRLEAKTRSAEAHLVPGEVVEQPLNFGENPALQFTVYPEDFSDPRRYSVTVTRDALISGAATLDAVLVRDQNGRMWPLSDYGAGDFAAANTGPYPLSVPSTMTRLALACTATDPQAVIQIGELVQTGTHDQAYVEGLEYDTPRSITVTVTAQNGAVKEYSFTVVRQQPVPANSNKLRHLWVNDTLVTGFTGGTTQYTVNVPNNSTSITIAAEAMEAGAEVFHGEEALTEGQITLPFAPPLESLDYTLTVVPPSGEPNTYTLSLRRTVETAPGEGGGNGGGGDGGGGDDGGGGGDDGGGGGSVEANDAALDALTVSGFDLSPGFDRGTVEYRVNVPRSTGRVNVTVTLSDPLNGSVKINGISALSGVVRPVTLSGDVTEVTIVTAAQNGDTMTYRVRVYKALAAPVDESDFILTLPDEAQGIVGFPRASVKIYQLGYATGEGAEDLPRTVTLTVPEDAGLTVHQWYIDEKPKGAAASITINARDYAIGRHTLSVVIRKGDRYYSKTMAFFVALE